MRKFKGILSIVLAVCIGALATACGAGGDGNEGNALTAAKLFSSGTPEPVGDIFNLPEISQIESGSAPIIAGITKQANPGDSIIVTGEGFTDESLKVYLYAQSTDDDGKLYEPKFQYVSDTEIVVIVDESIKYGIYGIYVETSKGTSKIKLVNAPEIWWMGLNEVVPGDTVTVYGENLTTDNGEEKTNIWLTDDDGYCAVEVTYADPYKVSFTVPETITAGKTYGIMLHNGHGGKYGFATTDETVKVAEKRKCDFSKGKRIDVTEYGALPDDAENDDSSAVKKAVAAAEDGDTIYFPNGTYVIGSRITVKKTLCFEGESLDTKIVMGSNVSTAIFYVKNVPAEFKNLSFYEVRVSGEFTAGMIYYAGNHQYDGNWNLYVHDCRFTQKTSYAAKSKEICINAMDTKGIIIRNNDFATTEAFYADNCEKTVFENNLYYGQYYAGAHYHQMAIKFYRSRCFDASNNYFASADILTDDTYTLSSGDLINGRSVVIQGTAEKGYISKNEIVCSGIPDQCAGEQIMYEGPRLTHLGGVISATENTIILDDDFSLEDIKIVNSNFDVGAMINVVLGKGVTQYRVIKSIDGNKITVTEPWDIIPNNESKITLSTPQYDQVVYKNTISGYKNHSQNAGGGCAVMTYNEAYNIRIVDNLISDMVTGIYVTQHFKENITASSGCYWVVVSGNKITNSNIGIRFTTTGMIEQTQDDILMHTTYGIMLRRNIFEDIVDWTQSNLIGVGGYGILCGRTVADYNNGSTSGNTNADWLGDWMFGSVIENNQFINCEQGNVLMAKLQGKTVLRNNTATGKITNSYTLENNKAFKPIVIE